MKPSVTPLASQALYGIGAAGVTSKQVHKYQLWEKYARCPQCGTTKVRTLK